MIPLRRGAAGAGPSPPRGCDDRKDRTPPPRGAPRAGPSPPRENDDREVPPPPPPPWDEQEYKTIFMPPPRAKVEQKIQHPLLQVNHLEQDTDSDCYLPPQEAKQFAKYVKARAGKEGVMFIRALAQGRYMPQPPKDIPFEPPFGRPLIGEMPRKLLEILPEDCPIYQCYLQIKQWVPHVKSWPHFVKLPDADLGLEFWISAQTLVIYENCVWLANTFQHMCMGLACEMPWRNLIVVKEVLKKYMPTDVKFPKNYLAVMDAVHRTLYKAYEHAYTHHCAQFGAHGILKALHAHFKHFVCLVREHGLVKDERLNSLRTVIVKLGLPDARQCGMTYRMDDFKERGLE